jgi:Phage T7 tail fibre protein
MTVPAIYEPASYTANGVTTVFPYGFLLLDKGHAQVKVNGVALAVDVGFTVSGVGSLTGGNVTISPAPADLAVVEIARSVPVERENDYQQNGDLLASTLNRDLDLLVMMVQELKALLAQPAQRGRKVRLVVAAEHLYRQEQALLPATPKTKSESP